MSLASAFQIADAKEWLRAAIASPAVAARYMEINLKGEFVMREAAIPAMLADYAVHVATIRRKEPEQ